MNRKKTISWLSALWTVLLGLLTALFHLSVIPTRTYVMAFIAVSVVMSVVLLLAIRRLPSQERLHVLMEEMADGPKFKVRRTAEGTVFEAAFVLLTVVAWALVVLLLRRSPNMNMLFPCIVTTVVGVCCLAGAYFPHTVNIPGVKIANIGQATLACRMMRLLAIGMPFLTMAIAYGTVADTDLPAIAVVAVMVVVCVVFTILIYKRK